MQLENKKHGLVGSLSNYFLLNSKLTLIIVIVSILLGFFSVIFIAKEVSSGNGEKFHQYPLSTPRRRLDDVKAAKTPVLTWMDSN